MSLPVSFSLLQGEPCSPADSVSSRDVPWATEAVSTCCDPGPCCLSRLSTGTGRAVIWQQQGSHCVVGTGSVPCIFPTSFSSSSEELCWGDPELSSPSEATCVLGTGGLWGAMEKETGMWPGPCPAFAPVQPASWCLGVCVPCSWRAELASPCLPEPETQPQDQAALPHCGYSHLVTCCCLWPQASPSWAQQHPVVGGAPRLTAQLLCPCSPGCSLWQGQPSRLVPWVGPRELLFCSSSGFRLWALTLGALPYLCAPAWFCSGLVLCSSCPCCWLKPAHWAPLWFLCVQLRPTHVPPCLSSGLSRVRWD